MLFLNSLPCALYALILSTISTNTYAQQCRLRASGDDTDGSPDDPFPTSSAPLPMPTSNSTATNGTNTTTVLEPFNYGTAKIRGVNLGGWFVLEPWITPSLFENTNNTNIVDEFTLGQMLDLDTAQQILQQHWETWITEDDFQAISAAGLNHVRIPLGYWSVPTNESVAPYVPGAWPYFLQALNWAKANGIYTIVDLHGAPGSQNGFDNSGQRTSNPLWAQTPDDISRTIDILNNITELAGGLIDVLELLNEPAAFLTSDYPGTLRQFWQDAYSSVRQVAGANMKIMIGDGFLGVDNWQNFLTNPSAEGVLMDLHAYQIFNYTQLGWTDDQHISNACAMIPDLVNYDQHDLWTVLGEWSAATTDCAKWLNGRNVGARWDGTWSTDNTQVFGSCDGLTGDMSTFSDDFKTFIRKYWEAQVDVGESVQGWIMWAWKTESADEWSYQKGLAGGWIPTDPTQRLYPSLCDSS